MRLAISWMTSGGPDREVVDEFWTALTAAEITIEAEAGETPAARATDGWREIPTRSGVRALPVIG